MSYLMNHEPPRKPKERRVNAQGEELIKNQECVDCKNMYTCKGKPRSTVRCLNYIQRVSDPYDRFK